MVANRKRRQDRGHGNEDNVLRIEYMVHIGNTKRTQDRGYGDEDTVSQRLW